MRRYLVWLCAASLVWASCGRSEDRATRVARPTAAAGESAEPRQADEPDPPSERALTIAARTPLSVRLEHSVASETSHDEDPVRAIVVQPVIVDGVKVIPSGSHIEGIVASVKRGGHIKGRAEVAVRFTRLVVKTASYPIRTSLVVRVGRSAAKKDWLSIGVPAGVGTLVGAAAGGGKGAIIGGIVGGGAGTAYAASTPGSRVSIPAGTVLRTELLEAVTVQVPIRPRTTPST